MKQKVAIGLSGGVDSSVAAALLAEQGYDVTGVYITCWDGPGCRSEEDRQDALDIALQLGIPFVHLDFQKEYKEKVYEYMIAEYSAGRTPNPDVMCNKEIKFGLFYEWALRPAQGKLPRFDFVATGHYAQIIKANQQSEIAVLTPSLRSDLPAQAGDCARNSLTYCLARSVDEHKDQTYFLYQLRSEQLEHILFPIGHLTKPEVRAEAEKRKLLSAKKPDSQGICFIGEVSVSKFLEERIEKKEGDIVLLPPHVNATQNTQATIAGRHRGVWFYTIGQKIRVDDANALKLAGFDTTRLPHFYVVKKDMEHNILYVGTEDQLYTSTLVLSDTHWIGKESWDGITVRIRHGGELVKVKNIQGSSLILEKPVWGAAPGQAVVLYTGTICLGGGILAE